MKSIVTWAAPCVRSAKSKLTLFALSLGLAAGFAAGQMVHSNAESTKDKANVSPKEQAQKIEINVSKGTEHGAPSAFKDMRELFNSEMLYPSWRMMLRPGIPSSFFKDFDLNSLAMDDWAFADRAKMPSVSTVETSKNVEITAEVPGFDKDSLDITVTRDAVRIAGTRKKVAQTNASPETQRKDGQPQPQSHAQVMEQVSIDRRIPLPYNVDTDKAEATVKNGIVTIIIPKSQTSSEPVKKLPIQQL